MKAQCKRLAGRSVLVGSTSFQFDDDGVCEVKPNGRGGQYYDFEVLLKMNGVVELKDEEKAPAEAEAAPAEPAPTAEKEDSEEEKTVEEELAAASFAPEMNDLLDDEEEKSDNKSKSKWKRGKKRNKKEND